MRIFIPGLSTEILWMILISSKNIYLLRVWTICTFSHCHWNEVNSWYSPSRSWKASLIQSVWMLDDARVGGIKAWYTKFRVCSALARKFNIIYKNILPGYIWITGMCILCNRCGLMGYSWQNQSPLTGIHKTSCITLVKLQLRMCCDWRVYAMIIFRFLRGLLWKLNAWFHIINT